LIVTFHNNETTARQHTFTIGDENQTVKISTDLVDANNSVTVNFTVLSMVRILFNGTEFTPEPAAGGGILFYCSPHRGVGMADAPRRSAMASLALAGLLVGIVWFSVLTVVIATQVLGGIEDAQADSYMAIFMGMVFLLLAAALDVYRKEFMPDELIHKIRRPKIVLTRAFRWGTCDELGERREGKGDDPTRVGPARRRSRDRRLPRRPRRPRGGPDPASSVQDDRR